MEVWGVQKRRGRGRAGGRWRGVWLLVGWGWVAVGWRVLEGAGEVVGVAGGRIITLGTMYSCTVYAGV